MHVVVIFQRLQKGADLRALLIFQVGIIFGYVAELAGDHRPTVLLEPVGHAMHGGALRQKSRTAGSLRNVVILLGAQWLHLIGPGLDRRRLPVSVRFSMMRLHNAHLVKKEPVLPEDPSDPALKRTRISGAVRLWLSV